MDRQPDGTDKTEPDPLKIKYLNQETGKIEELRIDPREMEQRIMKWLYG